MALHMAMVLGLASAASMGASVGAFKVPSLKSCHSISPQASDDWCNSNCNYKPPNCPSSLCSCDGPSPSPAPSPSPMPSPTPLPSPTPSPPGSLSIDGLTKWICSAEGPCIPQGNLLVRE